MKLILAAALLALLGACTSPESTRVAGSGPGADTGNRGAVLLMHEGSKPYEYTPRAVHGPAVAGVDPANQAHELSRP